MTLRLLLPLALVTALAWPAVAPANPLLFRHVGGNVFAGPVSPGPSAVYWNPAMLGEIRGHHFFFLGQAQLDATRVQRASINTTTGEPGAGANRSFSSVSDSVVTPGGFTALASDLNTNRYYGALAIYTPYAQNLPSRRVRLGEPLDTGYHATGGTYQAIFATVALAVRFNNIMSAGAGLSFVYPTVELRFARDRGLEDCPQASCEVENPALAEHYRVRTEGINPFAPPAVAFHAGLKWSPPFAKDRLLLGVGYVSAITPVGKNDISQTATATATGLEPDGQTAYRLRGDARLTYRLPQSVHLGARVDISPEVDALLQMRWVDFSDHQMWDIRLVGPSLRSRDVPEWMTRYRGFRDVVQLTGGVEVEASSSLDVSALLTYDSAAVPSGAVAPHQIDGPTLGASVGANLRLSAQLTVVMGYSLGAMFERTADQSVFSPQAFVDCRESGFDLDVCEPAREGRAAPTAAGTYNRLTHELSVGLSYQLWL